MIMAISQISCSGISMIWSKFEPEAGDQMVIASESLIIFEVCPGLSELVRGLV